MDESQYKRLIRRRDERILMSVHKVAFDEGYKQGIADQLEFDDRIIRPIQAALFTQLSAITNITSAICAYASAMQHMGRNAYYIKAIQEQAAEVAKMGYKYKSFVQAQPMPKSLRDGIIHDVMVGVSDIQDAIDKVIEYNDYSGIERLSNGVFTQLFESININTGGRPSEMSEHLKLIGQRGYKLRQEGKKAPRIISELREYLEKRITDEKESKHIQARCQNALNWLEFTPRDGKKRGIRNQQDEVNRVINRFIDIYIEESRQQ